MNQIRDAIETEFEHVLKSKNPRSDATLNMVSSLGDDLCPRKISEDVGQSLPGSVRFSRERQRFNPMLTTFMLTADAVGRVRARPQLAIGQAGLGVSWSYCELIEGIPGSG